jgi:trigger factor
VIYSLLRGTERLKITAERQPESQMILEIEVEQERVEKSLDQAYRRLSPKYRIPGFRPGKAPRPMFERFVGRPKLLREALERLVPEVYDEAIKEEGLDPVDQPVFDIPSTEPLKIKATVPLRPSIELGDYRVLRMDSEDATVSDDELKGALDDLRKRFATLVPVDRPVQEGDRLRVTILATIGEREIVKEDDGELIVTAEAMSGLPGLYDHLLGMTKDQSAEFDYLIPDDFEDEGVRGETVHYAITINEVKEEQLPELDDDLAHEVGAQFGSLAELETRMRTDMQERKTEQTERDFESKLIGDVIEHATLEYPPVMVDREIEAILDEQVGGNRAALEAAFRKSGGSMDTLRDRFRPIAVERVQRSLVLTKLAEREGLSVEDAEVDAEITRLAGQDPTQAARMLEMFNQPATRDLIARTLLTRKVYSRLKDIAAGKELPPQAALPDSDTGVAEYNEAVHAEAAPDESAASEAATAEAAPAANEAAPENAPESTPQD